MGKYEYDIPRTEVERIRKGTMCKIFDGRIQGSTECLNCTYCSSGVLRGELALSVCTATHYGSAHIKKTLERVLEAKEQ